MAISKAAAQAQDEESKTSLNEKASQIGPFDHETPQGHLRRIHTVMDRRGSRWRNCISSPPLSAGTST